MLGTVVVAPSTPPRDMALGPSKSGDYASKAKDNLTSRSTRCPKQKQTDLLHMIARQHLLNHLSAVSNVG